MESRTCSVSLGTSSGPRPRVLTSGRIWMVIFPGRVRQGQRGMKYVSGTGEQEKLWQRDWCKSKDMTKIKGNVFFHTKTAVQKPSYIPDARSKSPNQILPMQRDHQSWTFIYIQCKKNKWNIRFNSGKRVTHNKSWLQTSESVWIRVKRMRGLSYNTSKLDMLWPMYNEFRRVFLYQNALSYERKHAQKNLVCQDVSQEVPQQ